MRNCEYAFICVCLVLSTIPCYADIITVDDDAPADFDNIQAAVNDCNVGDIIIVQPGLYLENINFLGKNITLTSTEPNNPDIVASTIIDGNEAGSVVTFAGTESADCLLAGFTITRGTGTGSHNRAGGGIYGNGTLATILYNNISGNQADAPGFPAGAGGGGLYNCDGLIQYNVISENQAITHDGTPRGGGLAYCDGTISNNIILNNSAYDPVFASGLGGGMASCHGNIQNNIILGNYANYGGGLADCNTTIINCVIADNEASFTGGGVYDSTRSVSIISNCTIVGNSSNQQGGGVFIISDCNVTLIDSILWGNNASQGAQISLMETLYGPPLLSVSYSDVQGGQAQVEVSAGSTLNWGPGNIDTDPCFADVDANDYHLRSQAGRWDPNTDTWITDANHSLCIDTGDPNSDWTAELWPHGKRANMGAYGNTPQASMSLSAVGCACIGDLVNDGQPQPVTVSDLMMLLGLLVGDDNLKIFTNELNYTECADFVDTSAQDGGDAMTVADLMKFLNKLVANGLAPMPCITLP
jgi:hypothetical protein